jgi:hypothetical protein
MKHLILAASFALIAAPAFAGSVHDLNAPKSQEKTVTITDSRIGGTMQNSDSAIAQRSQSAPRRPGAQQQCPRRLAGFGPLLKNNDAALTGPLRNVTNRLALSARGGLFVVRAVRVLKKSQANAAFGRTDDPASSRRGHQRIASRRT